MFLRPHVIKMLNALHTLTRSNRLHRTSALSPLLWLTAILASLCGYGAITINDPVTRYVLIAFLGGVIIFTLMKYNYLLKKDPDRLHSEDHIAEMKMLDIIAKQGEQPRIPGPSEGSEPPKLLPGKGHLR